ncbi:hypothetical protein [Paenibacillus agaridevorans]|uniref:hypothetical protein n=1 Tax=Paenibacillus agaridevorans TaxID=171404 RepID=UPI001BE482F3|nr:hypothetical protein [Paenibacillus agaridevorans]
MNLIDLEKRIYEMELTCLIDRRHVAHLHEVECRFMKGIYSTYYQINVLSIWTGNFVHLGDQHKNESDARRGIIVGISEEGSKLRLKIALSPSISVTELRLYYEEKVKAEELASENRRQAKEKKHQETQLGAFKMQSLKSKTTHCFRCKKRLSRETHNSCYTCRWVRCDCGACLCNKPYKTSYRG